MKRSSGILLPISALPSPYGIGTLGKSARDFVDFLRKAGQSWWQVLPIGPTSYGDSPYQSFSTFAGNPYFIDLDALVREKLLTKKEINAHDWGTDPQRVDYEKLYNARFSVLELACARGCACQDADFDAFCAKQSTWLPDYALFMALKRHFDMRPWSTWPDDIRLRRPDALAHYRALLAKDVQLFTYIQYLFYKQWAQLKDYAHAQGVQLIGDLPIYVAMDSADVWAAPHFFQLDEDNVPTGVAGVPPDYFSETGQLWGNPLYDWDAMLQDGYGWWLRRLDCAMELFDLTRIDHFRGLESYWAIPYGEETAVNGKWIPGPGIEFIQRLRGWFGKLPIIAEDLGILTKEVKAMLKASGLPGMRVLQFAFEPGADSDYLPHNYVPNTVCYTGTHDNTTLSAWAKEATPKEKAFARAYLGITAAQPLEEAVLRAGMGSVAELFVAQLQDYLGLGSEGRTNTPGTLGENWTWRLLPGEASAKLAAAIRRMTAMYGRVPADETAETEL